ncbi:amino acid ABC transporter substrate-binding protein [Hoyosella sp. G463]|uniref:Amino acid ABC transporter substrate-binding protein n=1 Tax=Lolliginicoccus lacisalsi TaxID=2742202 RepID=A0A927JBY4_9ACTN|nr:ABC transporter substrate-binding protein [Lolliginicoccus lacisalsi]MBD8506055.1 amino acid ABC transporter substrate-binding protein [Lolliginicoccus lacisalsi]
MMLRSRGYRLILPVALGAMLAISCGGSSGPAVEPGVPTGALQLPDETPPALPAHCGPGGGHTVVPGVLTVAVDEQGIAPWVIDNDPTNRQGFEPAVAWTVAERLGFDGNSVSFVRASFGKALESGPKEFDFAINQYTIMGERRKNIDFSAPYYAVEQAVVALEGSEAAEASSISDLEDLRVGAYKHSSSAFAVESVIGPDDAEIFGGFSDAVTALADGDIDALVADLPTAVQIAETMIEDGVIVGKFPAPNEVTEFYGLVLETDDPLTLCATIALEQMYDDGTLEKLAAEWLAVDEAIPPLS